MRAEAAQQLAEIGIFRGDRRQQPVIGHAGADLDRLGADLEALQLFHLAEIDHGIEAPMLLGDPETDIGAAGEQGRRPGCAAEAAASSSTRRGAN